MSIHRWLFRNARGALIVLGVSATGCGAGGAGTGDGADGRSTSDASMIRDVVQCTPRGATESSCSDSADDDCDGFVDCLDPDCEAQSCGSGSPFQCTAGACVRPGTDGLPTLPRIENVQVTMRGSTAIVTFEPVEGARDYRIYQRPANADVLVGANGELAVRNAVYRCAGDLPYSRRDELPYYPFDRSISGEIQGYRRTEADSTLGYVYLTPGPGRQPVYRMGRTHGGWSNTTPPYRDFSSADYVVGAAQREQRIAEGYRDDGVAFYVPENATRAVHYIRWRFDPNAPNDRLGLFYTDGPEATVRARVSDPVERGERFRVLATQEPGSVALRRVFHGSYVGQGYDLLAPGEARFQAMLQQGNRPIASVTWAGLTTQGTFVVEALDAGCPFPGGYIAATARPGDQEFGTRPSITLDQARASSGEVYVNGQHAMTNRPRPIARAYVDLAPQAPPAMDFYESFDRPDSLGALTETRENNGHFLYRNDRWALDFAGCAPNLTFGTVLGQFGYGFGDWGSSCGMALSPRGIDTQLRADRYLHVRMSGDIPSTGRRYPQLILSSIPIIAPRSMGENNTEFHTRIANGTIARQNSTIIVQPFGTNHDLQIEFCDHRGWGVGAQCPRAQIQGPESGRLEDHTPWRALPILGDVAGFDRPVQLDVYASTNRVYLFADGQPYGCADLPAGRMPAGPVSVIFGAVLYHGGIDEGVTGENGLAPHLFLRRFSLMHTDRRIDDVGIDLAVDAPAWDEARMPCSTRFYGGSE